MAGCFEHRLAAANVTLRKKTYQQKSRTHPRGDATMSTIAGAAITTWKVESTHSAVNFKVRHMTISNLKGQLSEDRILAGSHEGVPHA